MANLTTGSLAALNDFVEAKPLDNFGTAGIIITGTWTGTISFEGSMDGTTYVPVLVQAINSTKLSLTTSGSGQFLISTSGLFSVRIRMSAYTSGTANIVVQANAATFLQRSLSTLAGDSDGNLIGNNGDGLKSVIKGSGTNNLAEVVQRPNNSYGLAAESVVAGNDPLATYRKVNTKVRSDGLTALVTDATVVVESTFGFDQQPDSYFQIINTGPAGTTWTIFIAGTANDPSAPDRDLANYTKIFTVQVSEAGDEIKLRDRMIQELNADTVFKNQVYLRANKATDRAIVHIQSTKFSASGEFYERPNAGDFNVTVGAGAVVVLGFDNLVSRSKPVTISRDSDSPHRLGLFGVTGTVSVTQKELSDLFTAEALLAGSSDLRVNGSVTPQQFQVSASSTTDLFIEHLIFHGQGNGIQFGRFLSQNGVLTNGVLVEIKSDDVISVLPVIKSTEDFKNDFAALSGDGANFRVDVQSGRDEMLAILRFQNPFVIRAAGTFSINDYIKVTIRDNLSAGLQAFAFRVKGFEKEP